MNRRRVAVVAALLAVAAILWLVLRGDPPPPPVAATAQPAPLVRPAPAEPEDDEPPPPPPAPERKPPLPPIIDAVLVEPPAVCDGEESLITVRAHTEGHAEDAYLHYAIGGELGAQVPMRVFATEDREGKPPPLTVQVFGRDNVVTEKVVPPIRVMDCKPQRRLHISARLLPNTIDQFELTARIVDVAARAPMRPVEARWSFGDGTTAVSQGPQIVHDYSRRPQDTHFSQLLVACEVLGADGEKVVGRTSLQLMNPSFEHLALKHMVLLYAQLAPRFPEIGPDGFVRQTARVYHHYKQPVTLTRVLRYTHTADGSGSDEPVSVDPARLLGTDRIPPEGVEARVELDGRAGIFSYEYTLEGTTPDGIPAQGAFSVMRPPDRPTRENSTPVVDPLLKAKILRARELLKQAYVTDEDLIRLGAQGAFDDLIEEAKKAPPPSGEAPMPPTPPK